MIVSHVTVKNFKRFREQTFELHDYIVLAGPNNSGKSTLLQAVAVWNLARRKWLEKRGDSSAKTRTGVGITRQDFTAIPLREMNLLWTDTSTALSREEADQAGKKLGQPRPMVIELGGDDNGTAWVVGFEFVYQNAEMISVRPTASHVESLKALSVQQFDVVHVPPFSGIGANEQVHTRDYQDLLVGQGKPGDIVRNLLVEVSRDPPSWQQICDLIEEVFHYRLLEPKYQGRPFILCEYERLTDEGIKKKGRALRLDIASAGSGFHQVLLLFAFIFARPATLLLLDEPDAHLHVVLQDQAIAKLRQLAAKRRAQLVVATHSEVILAATAASRVTSVFGKRPHVLVVDVQRDEVREALKRLTSLDLLLTDQAKGYLYVEDRSDFQILAAWANVLEHPVRQWFSGLPAWNAMKGRKPKEARAHFFALRAVKTGLRGLIVLDRDNRDDTERESANEDLPSFVWPRYEIESYLIHPTALLRHVETATGGSLIHIEAARNYLRATFPPPDLERPLANSPFLAGVPASKSVLPEFLRAAGIDLPKADFHVIAVQMRPDEISPDVIGCLDILQNVVARDV